MEINFGENNIKVNRQTSAFDNLLGAVTGNDFFDQKALSGIQAEQLEEAFFEWADNDFLE